jgi:hypothetical protein
MFVPDVVYGPPSLLHNHHRPQRHQRGTRAHRRLAFSVAQECHQVGRQQQGRRLNPLLAPRRLGGLKPARRTSSSRAAAAAMRATGSGRSILAEVKPPRLVKSVKTSAATAGWRPFLADTRIATGALAAGHAGRLLTNGSLDNSGGPVDPRHPLLMRRSWPALDHLGDVAGHPTKTNFGSGRRNLIDVQMHQSLSR